jgi:hypothetical protein
MPGRVLAETLSVIGITALLLFLGAGLFALDTASNVADAFLRSGPASVLGILGVALLVWAVLLLVAGLLSRNGSPVTRVVTDAVITLVVGAVSVVFWAVFAAAAGGFAALIVAIAITDVVLFCVAALIAIALTRLVLFRRRPVADAAVA